MTDGYKIKRVLTWVNGEEKQIYPASRLPSDYQEVEYIQNTPVNSNTAVQYINTGVYATENISCELTMTPLTTYTNSAAILGGGWSAKSIFLMFYNGGWRYHQGGNYVDLSGITTNKVTVNMSSTNFSVGSSSRTLTKGSNYQYASNIKLYNVEYLYESSSYRIAEFKTHELKIWDSGTLIRDMIPCYRKSDSVIGMYDIVNNQFYTNQGTGTFTKGPNV